MIHLSFLGIGTVIFVFIYWTERMIHNSMFDDPAVIINVSFLSVNDNNLCAVPDIQAA